MDSAPMELKQQQEEQSPSMDDCLKLLKGERDEQRLAGLLLLTKFCKRDDFDLLKKAYDAVGCRFLDRLLKTGLGKGSSGDGIDNRDAYLQLSVTVLSGFCRVPEIASLDEMVSKIPFVLEIISNETRESVLEECYEFVYLVSNASEDGLMLLLESGGLKVLSSRMSTLPDGSHSVRLAMQILRLSVSKLSEGNRTFDNWLEVSTVVAAVAQQFAVLQNAQKFEALHMLSTMFSSDYSELLRETLRVNPDKSWSTYIRVGIVAILQNRVVPADKLHALILAESVASVMGEEWLVGQVNLPNMADPLPADRCLLLVLGSSRVEVAVLLNELAYLKYGASEGSATPETISLKQQSLAIVCSLVEKIIKLISNAGVNEGLLTDDTLLPNVIRALNETIGTVLDYLQDAKEHSQKKGNDLLASVRVVGSYLAETPVACKEKVRELLDFMLLVEGEEESSPFLSVCFLLPMLCQITMEVEGCRCLVRSGGYRAVVECLVKLIGHVNNKVEENNGCLFLACDTVMNLLLKQDELQLAGDETTYISLLKALAHWADNTDDSTALMMAASICSLVFDSTSEDTLLSRPSFDNKSLSSLARLIARCLASWGQDTSSMADTDLLEIVAAGYSRWADRFPRVKETVER